MTENLKFAIYYVILISRFWVKSLQESLLKDNFVGSDNRSSLHLVASDNFKIGLDISCVELKNNFGVSTAKYSECAVKYAHPIRVCTECVNKYIDMTHSYKDLKNSSTKCEDELFNSDSLGVIDAIHGNLHKLWDTAHCDGCFHLNKDQSINYSHVADEVNQFFEEYNKVIICLNSSTDENSLSKICKRCNDSFLKLDELYGKVLEFPKSTSDVCMDVEDAMNNTRHQWRKFGCKPFNTDIGISNIIITSLLVLLPVTFYTIARFISVIEVINIVQPKRRRLSSPKE